MRVRLWLPLLTFAALALAASSVQAQGHTFFGPTCYGANYAYEYPNRARHVFGCGPGTHCQARHPIFKHRWARKHPGAANGGAPANAMMAPNGMPFNGMPANVMMMPNNLPAANVMMTPQGVPANGVPVEYVQAPIVQAPIATAVPAQTTSTTPAPVQAKPAVSPRIVPVPAPLPKGPASPEPPANGKPPF